MLFSVVLDDAKTRWTVKSIADNYIAYNEGRDSVIVTIQLNFINFLIINPSLILI